jgi:peptidyl-prolyl cis-trans isomerase B (cyclophilin B)
LLLKPKQFILMVMVAMFAFVPCLAQEQGFESGDTQIVAPRQNVPMQPAPAQHVDPVVVLETSKGQIVIRLFDELAPNTVNNFIDLVDKGFYNGLNFHRREAGFVVQGGCPNGDGTGNYIDPRTNQPRFLKLEINPRLRHNSGGVVAMARSNHPDSASCQFYITLGAAPHLDGKYAVFGGVIRGMNVVHSLAIGDKIISATVQQPN